MAKHDGGRSGSRDGDYKKKDKHWKGKRHPYKKHEDNDSDDGSWRKHKRGKGKWKSRKYDDNEGSSSDSDSDDDGRKKKRKDKKKNKKKESKSNDSDSGVGRNDDYDWNIGWVGRNNNHGNDTKDGEDDDEGNGDHCCLWKEISHNPFLRQVNAEVSRYLANNRKTFWSCSSPSSLDITMSDADQPNTNTAWQNKINNTPGAIMLMSNRVGRLIAQALHGYFNPWMDLDILNEMYMLTQKDADAFNSQGIGAYTVHSRRPIFPNGPSDLCVKLELRRQQNRPAMVMLVVSPSDISEFYCKTIVKGAMNYYRKDIQYPIEGFQVVVELDDSYGGVCLSLAMANLERAWDYVYSSFIKLPK
ncbi:hypothetical protein CDV36_011656 [Fusarium kuroshium]|uniref:Uncharacterized protein n=1 Tax=Fusarium kuroshium TaxID=2010991 RepID=A0A3M2RTV0_9HYPO|nr:hypothetical protein CDV36_011656 [Fusarium kuroshium]